MKSGKGKDYGGGITLSGKQHGVHHTDDEIEKSSVQKVQIIIHLIFSIKSPHLFFSFHPHECFLIK